MTDKDIPQKNDAESNMKDFDTLKAHIRAKFPRIRDLLETRKVDEIRKSTDSDIER